MVIYRVKMRLFPLDGGYRLFADVPEDTVHAVYRGDDPVTMAKYIRISIRMTCSGRPAFRKMRKSCGTISCWTN
jgi:hypothetical protein